MQKWQVVALLVFGIVLVAGAVLARVKFGDKFELKTLDLVLLVLPLLLVLLVMGKLKMLDAFGVKADFSELFADAARTGIAADVADTQAPGVEEVVNLLEMAAKGGVQDIPRLVEQKTQALVFRLGHGGYYGPAIERYLDALYASSYLQYLIILNDDGKLFGIYQALDVAVYFRAEKERAYRDFAKWLNEASTSAQERLKKLPGFVAAQLAVTPDESKREVLGQMDHLQVNTIPVVDTQGFFIGTVERSRLTSSLILEVAERIEAR